MTSMSPMTDLCSIEKYMHHQPRPEWRALAHEHHEDLIDWATHEESRDKGKGTVRGSATPIQILPEYSQYGKRLKACCKVKNLNLGYHAPRHTLADERAHYCTGVGARRIDDAVAKAFLNAINPAGIEAELLTGANIEQEHDAALAQEPLQIERVRFEAESLDGRFKAVELENYLVARCLEIEKNNEIRDLTGSEAELVRCEQQRKWTLTIKRRKMTAALGGDLEYVCSSARKTDRDSKELMNTLLFKPLAEKPRGDRTNKKNAMWRLNASLTNLHQWLNKGIISNEQMNSGRSMTSQHHRRASYPERRKRTRWLSDSAPSHEDFRRVPSDRVATCKAVRVQSLLLSSTMANSFKNQDNRRSTQALQRAFIRGGVL